MTTIALKGDGSALVLVGECRGHLGASLYLREIAGRTNGAPPPVDLEAERRNGDFVRRQISAGHVVSCHDVSDGGLLVAVAEMALASATPTGNMRGALLHLDDDPSPHALAFGEDQGRYVLEVAQDEADALMAAADAAGVPTRRIGTLRGRSVDGQWRADDIARRAPTESRGVASQLYGGLDSFRRRGSGAERGSDHADAGGRYRAPDQGSDADAQVTIEDLRGDGDHYAAMVVSKEFKGKSRVQQHQMVYKALQGRMGDALHALALQTDVPEGLD